ncbi:MAG: alpha/beta fold hydrolase [Thermaerobacter sp.]|nr:alpha/beta fold hydrolase [Thermaerobacter sp.]
MESKPRTWVLLAGAASGPDVWSRQHRTLPNATAFTYPAPTGADLLEDYVAAVLDQVPPPYVLVGHSLGGAVAQSLAWAHPEHVVGMALIGTGPHLPVNPALLAGLASEPEAMLSRIAGWSLARNADPRLRAECQRRMAAWPPSVAEKQFRACATFDLRGRLAPLSVPVRALVGAEDRMTPPPLVESLQEVWPGATTDLVPQAGHLAMLEQPDAVNAWLLARVAEWG